MKKNRIPGIVAAESVLMAYGDAGSMVRILQ
ncbi:MAG: hypothetical protein FD137_1445 [Spirochaetes bacterium]|nr:MAG: hypothetical protein FD137_1445 [Spirochaetota bacterium]